jgi:PAS domain S-box-containing protein
VPPAPFPPERRTRALRDLNANVADARTTQGVFSASLKTLSNFVFDLPFLAFYRRDADGYRLICQAGLESPSPLAPDHLTQHDAGPWPLAQLEASRSPVLVEGLRGRLTGAVGGPYEEETDAAFAMPIIVPGIQEPIALVLAGVSSRLPINEAYRDFYALLGSALNAGFANARTYEEEHARAEVLARLDRAKIAFYSNVSHEFRTPLTLLLGPLEDALARDQQPADRENIAVAHRNALRLLKLVNSLLDFSRLEAGRLQASFAPTDLGALTASLASNFRSLFDRAGIALDLHCELLAAPVFVDHDLWEKVVLNLISNAFKFTWDGGVTVSMFEDAGQAVLIVKDTGIGMPAEELPRIFDRFHRIDGQGGRSYEGTGIGLALVDDVIRLHGGTIEVESSLGEGSVFRVRLPFGSVHLPTDRIREAQPLESSAVRSSLHVLEALQWMPDTVAPAPLAAAAGEILPEIEGRAHILLADDNADMRAYLSRILTEGGYTVEAVGDGATALEALRRRRPDILLSDVMMPTLDGFSLLAAVRADPVIEDLIVILLSARAGEEARVEGLQAGADDYLVKPFNARELRARVDGAVSLGRLRRETANRDLMEERDRVWKNSRDLIATVGADGIFRAVNPAWTGTLGYRPEELIGQSYLSFVWPDDASLTQTGLETAASGKELTNFANRYAHKDGTPRTISWNTSVEGDLIYAYGRDITQEKLVEAELAQAQERLRQGQKIEAIGQLTGGVAHDFNNLLTIIRSSVDFLRRTDLPEARRTRYVEAISDTVTRATKLTSQLLAFARRQPLTPTTFEVRAQIRSVVGLVRPLMGSGIEVVCDLDDIQCFACVDVSQFETALVNLAVNARDAMNAEGRLTFSVRDVSGMPEIRGHLSSEGAFTAVSVTDTGSGIAASQLGSIFEPFFTTKEVGKGTGLGLSQVFGFAKQSGGEVNVESEVGRGSTFTLYLPCVAPPGEAAAPTASPPLRDTVGDGLSVLLVEDNEAVGAFATEMLTDLGYSTRRVGNAGAALALLSADDLAFDIVFSDVIMPGMTGLEMAQMIRVRHAGLPVILTSGYSDVIAREGHHGFEFLQKPYSVDVLSRALRKATLSSRAPLS